jgi:microsomal dipeptidase-like Zn-dependent dipeptidase
LKLCVQDLHGDSLLWNRNLLTRTTRGHIDVPRLQDSNVAIQAFTLVTTSPRHLNIYRNSDETDMIRDLAIVQFWPPRTWNSPRQRALYEAAKLHRFAAQSNGSLVIIKSATELKRFLSTRQAGQVAGLLGTEGAQPLEGELENLNSLYAAGIRMMAPPLH